MTHPQISRSDPVTSIGCVVFLLPGFLVDKKSSFSRLARWTVDDRTNGFKTLEKLIERDEGK